MSMLAGIVSTSGAKYVSFARSSKLSPATPSRPAAESAFQISSPKSCKASETVEAVSRSSMWLNRLRGVEDSVEYEGLNVVEALRVVKSSTKAGEVAEPSKSPLEAGEQLRDCSSPFLEDLEGRLEMSDAGEMVAGSVELRLTAATTAAELLLWLVSALRFFMIRHFCDFRSTVGSREPSEGAAGLGNNGLNAGLIATYLCAPAEGSVRVETVAILLLYWKR